MDKATVSKIVGSFNAKGVKYLVVGGFAVVAYGHVRFTSDLDLIVAVDPANLSTVIDVLESMGYRPRAPVPIRDFIDPEKRKSWACDKGMTVFSVFSAQHPATEVDLFLEPPFDFSEAYSRSQTMEIAPGVNAVFCGLADLLKLKADAGRRTDLDDIQVLKELHGLS